MRSLAGACGLVVFLAGSARSATGSCERPATNYRAGIAGGTICEQEARAQGLTVLDLSTAWVPVAFAPDDQGSAPEYASSYVALADERYADAARDRAAAARDKFLEIYGVWPSLRVIRERLADEARHRCHDAVDDRALLASRPTLTAEPTASARRRLRDARRLRTALNAQVRRRRLSDLSELSDASAYYRRRVQRLADLESRIAAVLAAESHLACDGLLRASDADGAFTWRTSEALAAFQRRHVLSPDGVLGEASMAALIEDSRELDFRAALRVLRERVIGATGLIEDGSAGPGPAPVLGRMLDPGPTGHVPGHVPLPDAAPDHVAAATEAAARALGWTDPSATLAMLGALPPEDARRSVAVALPPLPAYHARHMQLVAEVDRGDVWYDRHPRRRPSERRPALILYALDGERRIPLVRWPTTIGGWHNEKLRSGKVVKRWKESDVGPRVWRDLILAPRWLPPHSTPDDELVRPVDGGRYELRRSVIGPSYRGAFGLAMLIHHEVVRHRSGERLVDHGIRVHGSGNVPAIFRGTSHGCHRLVGGQALRLAGFLIQHRDHERHGPLPTWYRRTVIFRGRHRLAVDKRGYRIELTPPVEVVVLPGRIQSARKTPYR